MPKFSTIPKIAFWRWCVIITMYDGKCPFFKFIDKILGTDTQFKDYTKK